MANYPYSSPPPPPSPCNNTTSPILLPPPPPPPPACNHTSTPTLSPPPQSHYSHSPPSLSSPSPTPSPACTCNKNTTALPPPPPPLPSSPPPSPHSYYHSPPLASPLPPPSPPSSHYSPPVHSPPPQTPSYPSPPPPSQSPPKPSKTQASPPPLLQPTPPPSSSPYYFPQTPLHSPQSPDSPLCHCVCQSPWATPPSHYNSIPPNYYDSIAPAPHFMSPSNGQRTVIVTTFVSLGGVFFLSFIVIGLLSMAMKKRMPRMSGREQPDSHVQTQGDVHKFESIPAAAGTSTEHSVIDMGDHGLDPKPVENPKVQQVVALPDQGAGNLVEQALHQTSDPNVTDKKSSDTEFRKPSGEQSATNMDAPQGADEGNLDKSKSKLLDDQSVTDNADTSPNVEEGSGSQVVGDESNDSKKKLRLPKKKKSPSNNAKKGNEKRSGIRQVVNVASVFVQDEAQHSQDGDDDEERASESEPHDDDKELIASASNNTDENVEQPASDEQDAEERDDKPLTPQNVEESPIGEESNDSKQKLRFPNKKKPPSRVAKKEDKERSRVRQGVNVARTSVVDEAQQSQDADEDEERASESEPHDEDEELIAGASNNTDENVETADEQDVKHDDKPFSHQTKIHSRDSRQNMEEGSDAIGEESNYSKQNLHLPKKKKSPRSGAKKGNTQPYGVYQVLNPPNIYDPKEVENSQVSDNDEEQNESGPQDDEEPYESEPQDDDEELIPGGSNITDEIVEQPTTDEQEADQHDNKRLSRQTWTSNRDSGQNVEKGFNAAGEESSYSKKKLHLPKKKKSLSSGEKKGDEKRYGVRQVLNVASTFSQDEPEQSQDGDNNEEQVSELDAQDNDKALFLGGLTSADERVEDSTVDEQEADECDDKTFSHQTETNNRNSGQTVEEGSNAVVEELNDSKNKSSLAKKKKSPSSGAKKGNEKSSSSNVAKKENEQPYGIRQVLSPASIFDSEGVEKSQDDNINEEQCELEPQDGEEPYESEPHDDEEPYEEVQPQPNEEQSRRQEDDNDDVEVEESECVHDGEESNSCANDSSRVMVSLDDLEGKLKVSDPFSSARGSKQALSKAMGVVGDDYKDGKAKVHELKSGGSNKDSQGRQHHTQIRGAKKPLNFGKIGTAASDSDPGKALVIFDKVEESEPFASNVDSYMGQLQTSARGIEQSPNIFQNLTSTIDDDPAEGLKSLGDGHYKGKKTVHQLSKDSRRIKGQIIPPNRSEIVTTKIGDDLGKGLESLGGNQGEGSEKDGSSKDVPGSGQTSKGTQQLSNLVQILTATNEGDPNPEPGVYEDDKEYLSLEEPSPGEMEPSTDDQSASVTVDDDDPDVLQFHNNEYDEESAESNKDAPPGKPLSRPRTTNLRGKRRA